MQLLPFYCLILLSLAATPKTAMAFDWPAGAGLAQQAQALQQELSNTKILISSSQSKKPITAASYLAIDISNNSLLLKKNPDKAYSIASTTKLMNAVVTLENIDTGKKITLNKKMLTPEGSSPSIFSGLNISIKNLLQASLIQSVNDASESLAYSLGKEKFLKLMNQKAKDLKMTNTIFYDVHGLDAKNKSSARDMTKLLAYIYKTHPEILTTTRNNNFWLPDAKGNLLRFKNLNAFYNLPEFIGGKSGYSPEAKQTFAAVFNINKKPTAIVILRSTDYESDTFKIINQIKK